MSPVLAILGLNLGFHGGSPARTEYDDGQFVSQVTRSAYTCTKLFSCRGPSYVQEWPNNW